MKNRNLNTAFYLGFWSGILLFIGLNYYDFVTSYRGWDSFGTFGIPFTFKDGGDLFANIVWLGLVADILFALVSSFIFGFIFKFVWLKFTSRRLL